MQLEQYKYWETAHSVSHPRWKLMEATYMEAFWKLHKVTQYCLIIFNRTVVASVLTTAHILLTSFISHTIQSTDWARKHAAQIGGLITVNSDDGVSLCPSRMPNYRLSIRVLRTPLLKPSTESLSSSSSFSSFFSPSFTSTGWVTQVVSLNSILTTKDVDESGPAEVNELSDVVSALQLYLRDLVMS